MIKFKPDPIHDYEKEFDDVLDSRLKLIIFAVAGYLEYRYNLDLLVTCVMRNQEEQDNIYLNHSDPNVRKSYNEKKWYSTHQFARGLDCTMIYKNGQRNLQIISVTAKWINDNIQYSRFGKRAAVPKIDHIHFQVNYDNSTLLVKEKN